MPHRTYETFKKGNHAIHYGDALAVLEKTVPDASIDLIFADPPYNIGKRFADFQDRWPSDEAYATWCEEWLGLCIDKLTPHGTLYVMASTQSMPFLDIFLRRRLRVISRIVWHYDSSGVQAKTRFGSTFEPILHCVKNPRRYTFNREAIQVEAPTGAKRKLIDYRKQDPAVYSAHKVPGNVWYFPRVRYRMAEYEQHPSQKPEALLERIILASSNPGDRVLDPFAGTFTTSAVAKRLGRKSIGIEAQEAYVKIGLRRLGIADTYKGERLTAPEKRFGRRNGKLRTAP